MTGFEPRTSGVRRDHSTNSTTTTALVNILLVQKKFFTMAQRILKIFVRISIAVSQCH